MNTLSSFAHLNGATLKNFLFFFEKCQIFKKELILVNRKWATAIVKLLKRSKSMDHLQHVGIDYSMPDLTECALSISLKMYI